ncbi:protein kinase [Streptosporangium sp. NBC_01755]|uniref:serine/threonine-protein kinase n=1 Tax=unclassified Streptosporangium TaxID=2632669 RepID=UPI002DDAC41D|nr:MULTISPECIES: protein kinase [unclassified Streptosporangium]WSA22831.1 protein kinase [Streptosporangium sp. NBC_01810]WSC99025.1 protein kinase [Streptosporangium sp. NBC_01755]
MAEAQPEGRLIASRYHLLEAIGRGGMGIVWRAHDELLDREVAIKEVRYADMLGEDNQEDFNRRTKREARAAGRLTHPNVVVVHDVVEEDGRPWIVMQLVESRSLGKVLRQDGPLPPQRVAEIGLQVLDALRAAHAQGVLHRDVKPENVLLADDGRVVLTDFGIATLEAETALTMTGIAGTPAFIPPERIKGGAAQRESDLWSLGATMYAAVEGKPPHDRGGALPTMHAILNDEPETPVHAGPLAPVLEGLLRKDPALRMPYKEAERLLRRVAEGAGNLDRPARTALMPAVSPAADTDPGARFQAGALPETGAKLDAAPAGAKDKAAPARGERPSKAAAETPAGDVRQEPGAGAKAAAKPASKAAPGAGSGPAPEAPGGFEANRPTNRVTSGAGAAAAGAADAKPATAPTATPVSEAKPSTAPTATPVSEAKPADVSRATPPSAAASPAGAPEEKPAASREDAPPTVAGRGFARQRPTPVSRPNPFPPVGREPSPRPEPAKEPAEPAPAHWQEPVAPSYADHDYGAATATLASQKRGGSQMKRGLLVLLPALLVVGGVAGWLGMRSRENEDASRTGSGKPGASSTPNAPSAPSGGAKTTPQGSPEPAPSSAPPSPSPTKTEKKSDLPSGWRMHKDSNGFSIGLPKGWNVDKRPGQQVWFRGPDRTSFVFVEYVDRAGPDPKGDWENQEGYSRGNFPGYKRVKIAKVDYMVKAADWEFTWQTSSGKARVINRGFVTKGGRGYAIYWHTLAKNWKKNMHFFEGFTATFSSKK